MGTKALRRAQLIPGVLYGPGFEPRSLQIPLGPLNRVLRQAGQSHLIELSIEGSAGTEVVLVRDVQRDPVTSSLVHIDLYRTRADENVRLSVPLVHVGEAPAVEQGGVVLSLMDGIEVECLPRDLPESLHVDLTRLVDMQSVITVADLEVPSGVTVLSDAEAVVARVTYPTSAAAEAEGLETGAEEAVEGQAPEEGGAA